MNEDHAADCLKRLRSIATTELKVGLLAHHVLDCERFRVWSGSSRPHQHHYGDYGLVTHTWEVVNLAMMIRDLYPQYEIDKVELFLACLFHDYGKTEDYEKVDGVWRGAEHKRLIHHVSKSAIYWNRCLDKHEETAKVESLEKYREPVTHAILAHHGQREWGSPVAPKSRVAWILHKVDGISARLFDAETLDRY